jgi:hypothetical protein
MNYNPYAPPQAAPPPNMAAPGAGSPQPWEIGEVLGLAWTAFTENWAVLVFSVLVTWLITLVPLGIAFAFLMPSFLQLQQNSMLDGLTSSSQWAFRGVGLAITVVQSFFQVGLIRIWISAARKGSPEFSEVFQGGRRFLPLLGLNLLLYIPYQIASLLIFPAFVLYVVTWGAEYFIVDAELGVFASLMAYLRAVRGQWGMIVLFLFVGVLLFLAGSCACCVGLLVSYPLVEVAKAIVYLRVSGRADMGPRSPQMGLGGPPLAYGGAPPGYGGPPGGPPPAGGGYGGPPPGAPPGGYGPPGGGGYGPPGGGYGGPPPAGG